MKKILIIVLVVLLVAFGIYFFFAKKNAPSPAQTIGQTGTLPSAVTGQVALPSFFANGGANPGAAANSSSGRVSFISTGPVIAYSPDFEGAVAVVQPDGEILQLNGSQSTILSSSTVSGLISADFSYDGRKVVLDTGGTSNMQAAIFDLASTTWTPLVGGVQSPEWAPGSYRLAYLEDGGNGTESLFVLDMGKPKPSPTLMGIFHIQDALLSWVDANRIAIYDKPSSYTNGSAFLFDLRSKALTLLMGNVPGLEAKWYGGFPEDMGLAFSVDPTGYTGHLQLVNFSGVTIQNISFVTLPSKCTFYVDSVPMAQVASSTPASSTIASSSTTSIASSTAHAKISALPPANLIASTSLDLYCGVPRDQTSLSYYHLPDDYEQYTIQTVDNIYRINTVTGVVTPVFADPSQSFDVSDPSISNNSFLFINRYDQRLYAVSL